MLRRKKKPKNNDFKSFRTYCIFLFKQSIVTGVAPIIKSKGCCQTIANIVILVFSMAGFLFQTFQFLQIYWQYATVESTVDLNAMIRPAVTICPASTLRRTWFCTKYRNVCKYFADDSKRDYFSLQNRIYCWNGTTPYFWFPYFQGFPTEYFELNFTKAAAFPIEDILIECTWHFSNPSDSKNHTAHSSCGNIRFLRGMNEDKIPVGCYILGSHHGEGTYVEEILKYDTMLKLKLKWFPADTFPITPYQRYYLSFHHPRYLSNPFYNGLQVRDSKRYQVHIHQKTFTRLPRPYVTQCIDYERKGSNNGGEGPLHKRACDAMCEIKAHLDLYQCVLQDVTYPHEEKICPTSPDFDVRINTNIRECILECFDACQETRYVATAEVLKLLSRSQSLKLYGTPTTVTLKIHFNVLDSVQLKYTPRYESVELFSYIGGYLGMWLGWSLVAIFDFLGTVIRLCQYPLMKKKQGKKIFVRPFNKDYDHNYALACPIFPS